MLSLFIPALPIRSYIIEFYMVASMSFVSFTETFVFPDPAFASAIFKVCFNPTLDDGTFKPASWFADSLAFILPDVTDPKLRFYVHCVAGINRSASTVYAVLRALGLNPMAARLIIELNRPLDFVGLRYASDADVALKKLHYID